MRIAGALRVKNESRWISRVLDSIRPLCDPIIVLDDHSTDGTPGICEAGGAIVYRSTFTGIDESRDKDFLLDQLLAHGADWCLMIDGDEILEPEGPKIIRAELQRDAQAYQFRILYLWDGLNQVRTDGVYGRFWRPSMFRVVPGHRFKITEYGANFHCSSVPQQMLGKAKQSEAQIYHLGYMLREDRIRKYRWYNQHDGGNSHEDGYRHIVQGDIPEVPAGERLQHAGPLKLEALR